jgi:hypothetical protein
MFVDPQEELRFASGEPPDDADRRRTGPASEPSEEADVTFLDDEEPDLGSSDESEPDADDSPRPSR